MALVGLVRVSTDKQETARQHDALDPICVKVFEEKISGKLQTDERPGLSEALEYLRDGDMLTVLEANRLGRNLLDGLLTLGSLFERGVAVKILTGIAAGEHTERSFVLDLALALAEDRAREISRSTKQGLESARKQGRVGGRRAVMDKALTAQAVALRDEGFTLHQIRPHLWYRLVGGERRNPSIGSIHKAIKAHDEAKQETAPTIDTTRETTTP